MTHPALKGLTVFGDNRGLAASSKADIDARIARLLNDLGNPEPPLQLETVRDLLKLDRRFYSLTDPSTLDGVIHRLRIAGRNLVQEPRRLFEVVTKLSLRALVIPERKQILLDAELPTPKQRWAEGHEIVHSILEWHAPYCHGDRDRTISEACHAIIEAEANYGNGRLLFLGSRFEDEIRAGSLTMDRVRDLAKLYRNSVTSTLWRSVEYAARPAIGLVSVHPWIATGELAMPPIRYAFASPAFCDQFPSVLPQVVFAKLAKVVTRRGAGPLGSALVCLADHGGAEHEFQAECFSNNYDVLSLLVYDRKVPRQVAF